MWRPCNRPHLPHEISLGDDSPVPAIPAQERIVPKHEIVILLDDVVPLELIVDANPFPGRGRAVPVIPEDAKPLLGRCRPQIDGVASGRYDPRRLCPSSTRLMERICEPTNIPGFFFGREARAGDDKTTIGETHRVAGTSHTPFDVGRNARGMYVSIHLHWRFEHDEVSTLGSSPGQRSGRKWNGTQRIRFRRSDSVRRSADHHVLAFLKRRLHRHRRHAVDGDHGCSKNPRCETHRNHPSCDPDPPSSDAPPSDLLPFRHRLLASVHSAGALRNRHS